MPAARPQAAFRAIPPEFDLKSLVESTDHFHYVDRINCGMIEENGMAAFEKLVLFHVVIGGKPLVIDGFEEKLKTWAFTPKWLNDNCGDKVENARNLTSKSDLPLTMAHYLRNMRLMTNQFFDSPTAYRDSQRQRVYLKDIDCPAVWWDILKEQVPACLAYLNESTGEIGGPGAVPDPNSNIPGRRMGKGIARAGDLMSSLPKDMRAENLMCYIGHEGTYTPAHREMCASLGHNIMVEASGTVSDDGQAEKPGSSIWFMTESKDRHVVSEYWLDTLGHDIEVETHFAQIVAWKRAKFNVYVVEQRPGDLILIPPLAPHQVWNRGTRTMKVAWNRTTVESLEMALNEALPRSRIVCRDEQYKNKAIVYFTLQKYSSLLTQAHQQAMRLHAHPAQELMYSDKLKALKKDFKRLFSMYRQILLSETFNPDDREAKSIEYLPFDSNVTCAYCRGNIFNRFLSCPSCKNQLGHHEQDSEGDPYDVCMDCYAMGRSCACISGLKWVEQFKWKELVTKYDTWRNLIILLDHGQITNKTPRSLNEERKTYGKKTLAEVCKDQLKRRPFKDINKSANDPKEYESEEEIVVDDNGMVKKTVKRTTKAWLKNNQPCHVCKQPHPTWKMAQCTTCQRWWCYGTLFRGWDKMPLDIMEDPDFSCPHCRGICFAGACKREGKMTPYEPKGTLLGHDTRKVADVRSVEALVDFSISNLQWLKDDNPAKGTETRRLQRAAAEAQRDRDEDPLVDDDEDDRIDATQVEMEDVSMLDPALGGDPIHVGRLHDDNQMNGVSPDGDDQDAILASRLQSANSALPPPAAMMAGAPASRTPEGYAPLAQAGYPAPPADMYPQPEDGGYRYPGLGPEQEDSNSELANLRPFKRRREEDDDDEDIAMQKAPKTKKPRLQAAWIKSTDLAMDAVGTSASKAKTATQRKSEQEKERKALEKAKQDDRFLILTAALKGKKSIIVIKVPGARLAQLLARQAAKAALNESNVNNMDADHEVIEGAATNEMGEPNMSALLKSDIVVKKPKYNATDAYQRRVKEGKVVTGQSKRVLIPVEDDGAYYSRINLASHDETTAAAVKKRNRRSVAYEEVDVGSDADEDLDDDFAATDSAPTKRGRRSLPSYLQDRHADEDDLPDELPSDFRDGKANRSEKSRQRPSPAERARLAATASNQTPQPQPGGKRPSMRPSINNVDEEPDDIDAPADDDSSPPDVTPSSFNGVGVPNSGGSQASARGKPAGRPRGRPRGRPSRGIPSQLGRASARKNFEEQNRLAKLQALQMVENGEFGGAPSPSETLSNGDDQVGNSLAGAQLISSGGESDYD